MQFSDYCQYDALGLADDADDDKPIPQTINWAAERAAERRQVQNHQAGDYAPTDSSSAIRLSPAARAMRDLRH